MAPLRPRHVRIESRDASLALEESPARSTTAMTDHTFATAAKRRACRQLRSVCLVSCGRRAVGRARAFTTHQPGPAGALSGMANSGGRPETIEAPAIARLDGLRQAPSEARNLGRRAGLRYLTVLAPDGYQPALRRVAKTAAVLSAASGPVRPGG
jgi:hypothetical protein